MPREPPGPDSEAIEPPLGASDGGLRGSAVRGSFWSALQQFSDKGLRWVVYLVLAALIGPGEIGLVALALAFIDAMSLLLNQGLSAAIVQRRDLLRIHLDTAFWCNVAFAALLAVATLFGAGQIAALLRTPDLISILPWLAAAFLLTAGSATHDALLRRHLDFRALALRTVIGRLAGAIVGVVLALRGAGAFALVWMHLVSQAVSLVVLWIASGWRPALRCSWKAYLELLHFGSRMIGVQIATTARERGDVLLLGTLLGKDALGFYEIGKGLVGGLVGMIGAAVGPVIWSTLSRLQSDRERLRRAVQEAAQLSAVAVAPLAFGLMILAPQLVPFLYRGATDWSPAVPVVQALCAYRLALTLGSPIRSGLAAISRMRERLRLDLAATALILVVLAGAATLGADLAQVAWSMAAAALLAVPLELLLGRRLLGLDALAYLRALGAPLLAALATAASTLAARRIEALEALGEPWHMLVLVAVGALSFVVALRLFGPSLWRRLLDNLALVLPGRFAAKQ